MIIVDSCMIRFHFDCIMQLKKSYHITTNVCSRKKCYYFWWSPWLLNVGHLPGEVSTKDPWDGCMGKRKLTHWSRKNGQHQVDWILKCIFWNVNIWISTKISTKYVTDGPVQKLSDTGMLPKAHGCIYMLHLCQTKTKLVCNCCYKCIRHRIALNETRQSWFALQIWPSMCSIFLREDKVTFTY